MRCTNPLHLRNSAGTAPCGKCTACRISRAKEWSLRLIHEAYYWDDSLFVTLTYDQKHMPENWEINKTEVQNFFKRLRKQIPDRKIKYYATGEYGDQTQRPHYHAIIFGLSIAEHKTTRGHVDSGPLLKAWDKGYVYVGTATTHSCLYVAKYIQKKLYGPLAKEDGREQPFALMSNAIGKSWLDQNKEYLLRNFSITHNGKRFQIPKYYIKKMDEVIDINGDIIQTDTFKKALKANNDFYWQEKQSYYDQKYTNPGESTVAQIHHREQVNRNLNALNELRKDPI